MERARRCCRAHHRACIPTIRKIVHCFVYFPAGRLDDDTVRIQTIRLVEHPMWPVNTGDTKKQVVFTSFGYSTPCHGSWLLMTPYKLHISFNARYGKPGFEDGPLHSVVLWRVRGSESEWKGHDDKGKLIFLGHVQYLKQTAIGPYENVDKL